MNIIENVWNAMVNIVYANNKQYSRIEDLEKTIYNVWQLYLHHIYQKLFTALQIIQLSVTKIKVKTSY